MSSLTKVLAEEVRKIEAAHRMAQRSKRIMLV